MKQYWGYGNRIIRGRLSSNPRFSSEIYSLWLTAQQKIHNYQTGKTDQGSLHCIRVEDNVGMLLKDFINEFKDEDLFILSASCALHDIGKIEHYPTEEPNHGREGARLLRKPEIASQFLRDERLVEAIAYVISCHDDGDLHEIPEDEFLVGTCPIFLRELASIFRLADMLETDYRRISSVAIGMGARKFIENEAVWLARKAIKGWKSSGDKIVFQATPRNSRESTAVLTCIRLMKESLSDDQIGYLRGARVVYFDSHTNKMENSIIRIPHLLTIDSKDLQKFPKASMTRPQPVNLLAEIQPLEITVEVRKNALVILRIYNNGRSTARNVEVNGWEHYPELTLISGRRIGDIPPYSRVEWPLKIRPTKRGSFRLEHLVLTYEEGNKIEDPEIQIPPFVINAIVRAPRLRLEVVAPRSVRRGEIFDTTIRIANTGDGEAQDISFEIEVDPRLIISGSTKYFVQKLLKDETQNFKLTLKAPSEKSLEVGQSKIAYTDIEGNLYKSENPAVEILITDIEHVGKPHTPIVGDVIENRYLMRKLLGSGAFSNVWLVQDRRLGRQMVLKLMKQPLLENTDLVQKFIQEAGIASTMPHVNLITIYDAGLLTYGGTRYPYVLMEFVKGKTLQTILEEGAISLNVVIQVLFDISKALQYLHQENVVHGDIKPSNIMYEETYRLWKLADFLTSVRLVGSYRGTPSYSAPEAISELALTAKGDIYSLGAVLREMLTGHPNGDLSNIKQELIDENKIVAIDLGELAANMTNQNPSERPTAMDVFVKASQTWPPAD